MTQQYYIQSGENQRGPLTRKEVENLLFSRQCTESDLIWCEGMGDYIPIAQMWPKDAPGRFGTARGMAAAIGIAAALVLVVVGMSTNNPALHLAGWLVGWALGLLFYFIPSLIAWNREHRNLAAIVLLNLLLGWTFLGWVIALIWSATAQRSSQTA